MKKIIINFLLLISICFSFNQVLAGAIDFNNNSLKDAKTKIEAVSIEASGSSFEGQIKDKTTNIFKIIKTIVGGILVLFIIFAGIQMTISMGENEEEIKKAKQGILYAFIGIVFINIPGTIYNSFSGKSVGNDVTGASGNMTTVYNSNVFMNSEFFGKTIGGIIDLLQILVLAIAVLIIVMQGIKIIMSMGKSDDLKEPKNKIMYSIVALIFLGVMQVWKNVVFTGDLAGKGKDLFTTLANLALYFAAPTAIAFISWAGYLYLTANGKEDNTKKAKAILINTFVAVIILLGIFTFFKDLSSLTFTK